MKTFHYNQEIKILGATFHGVQDIIRCALKQIVRDGVYVDCDYESYPCFDSSDYASEDRHYWNFVFATSLQELHLKLKMLYRMKPLRCNYNKFTEHLHPMAYWGGDPKDTVLVTGEPEDEEPVIPKPQGEKTWQDITPKAIGVLDMVIAFDTTGSMASYIGAVRREVAGLIPRLFRENQNLRIGIVAFGDYCDMVNAQDFGNAYQCLMPTNNERDIIKFVRESKDTSGGDSDEFYELVLRKIIDEIPWREEATRVILLISDANPHPVGYSYEYFVVNNQIDWREEARKAAQKKIKIDTVTITDAPWYKELSRMTNGVSVPFENGEKTARLVEIATMARGSEESRCRFDLLSRNCRDSEERNIFDSYNKERNRFD